MGADVRWQIEPADLRIQQILVGRLLRTVQQLLAVDDLDDAPRAGAVAEVDAIAIRSERDGAVKAGRRRADAAGLLTGQPEIANEHRLGRIAQIVDLGHAIGAPAGRAGHQIGDAGVAFPPVLMRGAQSADDDGQARWLGRIGDVPDLMAGVAGVRSRYTLLLSARGSCAAVADPDHLRAAGFALTGLARNVREVLRLLRVRHVDDRRAVALLLTGERVERHAAVMADVGDPAVVAFMSSTGSVALCSSTASSPLATNSMGCALKVPPLSSNTVHRDVSDRLTSLARSGDL